MRHSHFFSLLGAAFLLVALTIALPDGEDRDMDAAHKDSMAKPAEDQPQSYFALGEHSSSILMHITLEVISWCFILPLAVMLSVAHSRYSILIQCVFLIVNAIALLFGIIYSTSTPDLYENNAHHKIGWIATWVVCPQVVIRLIYAYSGRGRSRYNPDYVRAVSTESMTGHQQLYSPISEYRWSGDSGQGTICPTTPDEEQFTKPEDDSQDDEEEAEDVELPTPLARNWLRCTALDKFFARRVPSMVSNHGLRILRTLNNVVDRIILPFGFITIATGGVTYGGIFKGQEVFNGLAHFIKGGIFFWYGLVVLGRYMGCWAKFGWSWNLKPAGSRAVTAEFVESALIFTYGSTNVFLEHLAGWGKAWTAQDLEHVLISVMFFGAGLCGMLLESNGVRNWLKNGIIRKTAAPAQQEEEETSGVSFNPMPLLIIFLLGIMMGGHKQQQMVATMVHKQWGNLLSAAAIARAVTYMITYIKPPTSHFPARPPSELVGAFCLISGGLIFMLSASDIMDVMVWYDLDAIFTFNVAVAVACFIMAYEIIVIAIKALAVEQTVQYHAHSLSSA